MFYYLYHFSASFDDNCVLICVVAFLMACSANIEQCNLTGGKLNSFANSLFVILAASSNVIPTNFSVAKLLQAMALPHPNVLNLASTIVLLSSPTLICIFIISPHAGAPTIAVATLGSFLSNDPTFLGFS